ncbi:dihydrodipicolinate synthase family protein [Variovorax sp. PBL-E5]|uniref:dihydrodipicolinate synthase family protein n=1 Tax=Variovorax sp. PBL-E5 TaxID=434014 RepID=UPI001318F797|nr:dihydrodipicolinate synthase family protein [Variovorax sp. PBL-E5]VTU42895.1 putative 2-keto-3-deoxy-galactonate aldolase YagE [Variovorax sp. PBL-E5]
MRDLASVKGVTGICVNGHASEVMSCTEQEQARILTVALEEVGNALPVIGGVYSESSIVAAQHAKQWQQLGANALLVVPPAAFGKGAQLRPEMVMEHYQRIADACDLPLIIFQYAGAQMMAIQTLTNLADTIPSIKAIKDYCGDPVAHEETVRQLQNSHRKVNVLTAHSSWLLQSLALGCEGILSGAGSTVAALQAELFEAMKDSDLPRAREINERLDIPNKAFYHAPMADQHNRMKEAQVLMGRFPHAVVRPPLMKLSTAEIDGIRAALAKAVMLNH